MNKLNDAQRALISRNIGIARKVAHEYERKYYALGIDYDDLFSEACLGIIDGSFHYDPSKASESCYMMSCARNAVIKLFRRQTAEKRDARKIVYMSVRIPSSKEATFGDLLVDTSLSPLDQFIMQDEIKRFAQSLNERETRVAVLKSYDLKVKDIAEIMGITPSNVEYAMCRIRKKYADIHKGDTP